MRKEKRRAVKRVTATVPQDMFSFAEIEADTEKIAKKFSEYQSATAGDETRREIIKRVNEIFRTSSR
jgi:hypothetical protein